MGRRRLQTCSWRALHTQTSAYKNIWRSPKGNQWVRKYLGRIGVVGEEPRVGPAFTSAASTAVVCCIEGIVDGARPVAGDEDDLGKVRGAPNVVEGPRQLLRRLRRAEG